ncbi:MAG: LuxR C-terminal-related transcriptional regulator [Planctomycetia bacterium]|jgi:DNA-binding NarL/FixJ family response regulator
MPAPITLLVAYPKEVIRAGLRVMLAGSGIRIVAEADDVTSALSLATKHKPAVVLLDAIDSGGRAYKFVRDIRKAVPGANFVFLAAVENPTYCARAKAVGASNVLLESVATRELVAVIENVAAGKSAKPPELFAKVSAAIMGKPNKMTEEAKLTPRELQVLAHVAFGLINEEIAQSLGIDLDTVKSHIYHLLRKIGARDRTHMALRAVNSSVI